jgi:hypothetical protein
MTLEPKVGDKYRKNGVNIIVHAVDDSQVYCGRWDDKGHDLVRVSLQTWKEQIIGAEKL